MFDRTYGWLLQIPKKITKSSKRMVLDGGRAFPPVRGCVFTEGNTCVHFMADPAAGLGLPRGAFLYASAPLPQKVSYCNALSLLII